MNKIRSLDLLFERVPPTDYIKEWMEALRSEKESISNLNLERLLIFRLHKEWFALSTEVCSEICELKPVHRVPHIKSEVLRGLVNIRGQIRLFVALDKLLSLVQTKKSDESVSRVVYERLVEIEKEGEHWTFAVDEVYGILGFDLDKIENVPLNVVKSKENFLKGIFTWDDKSVGWLDTNLIFHSLKRSI